MDYITLENDRLKVSVKLKGAELFSAILKETEQEYIWSGDPAYWGKTSPVLFPIVGTLKEDSYYYQKKKYSLSRHGFARDLTFEVEKQSADESVFVLRSSSETLSKYPFQFEFRIKYKLDGDFLKVTYEVKNVDKQEMYFSVGGHPAFRVPLSEASSYEDYFLEFSNIENADRWPISQEGLIEMKSASLLTNSNRINLTRSLFSNDALVLKNLRSDSVSLKSTKHRHGLNFKFEGFPFLGIWAAKNADFVCIEPWCGIADSIDHNQQLVSKEGIEKLSSNMIWSREWSVMFF